MLVHLWQFTTNHHRFLLNNQESTRQEQEPKKGLKSERKKMLDFYCNLPGIPKGEALNSEVKMLLQFIYGNLQ